jgi:hypothetical protein
MKEGLPEPSRFFLSIDTGSIDQLSDVLKRILKNERQVEEKPQRDEDTISPETFSSYVRTWYAFYSADPPFLQISLFSCTSIVRPTTVLENTDVLRTVLSYTDLPILSNTDLLITDLPITDLPLSVLLTTALSNTELLFTSFPITVLPNTVLQNTDVLSTVLSNTDLLITVLPIFYLPITVLL